MTLDPQLVLSSAAPLQGRAVSYSRAIDTTLASLAPLEAAGLRSDAALRYISQIAQQAAQRHDQIDAERKSATGALTTVVNQINGWFRPPLQGLKEIETRCKGLIGRYHLQQREAQQAAFDAARAAMLASNTAAATAALETAAAAAPATVHASRAELGASVREVWRAVVRDAHALPREYLTIDQRKLDAHARATPRGGEPTPIPGVEFVKDTIVSVART